MKNHNIYSVKYPNSQLGFYLAGLIEGDGNIWTPKTFKSSKGRIYNPQIAFTFHKKEKPLFLKLKSFFNTGTLYEEKVGNACKYRISETNSLVNIINLINGKFRTPKINDLHRAIDHINKMHKLKIEKLCLNESSIDSNAWLAGFTDADGHFQISLSGEYKLNESLQFKSGRVKCTFSIKQRMIDRRIGDSLLPIMSKIAGYFCCNVRRVGPNELTFLAQANNKHFITTKYFSDYPLMTSKYLDYLCFHQGLNYLGKRLTKEEVVDIQKIKNSMNRKRIFYNWDHLDKIC